MTDYGALTDQELRVLRADAQAELTRREDQDRLPGEVAALAARWAGVFPEDPNGWRDITAFDMTPQEGD